MTTNKDPPETDGPRLLTNQDLPKRSEDWEDVRLPIDILLLTAVDCEFLSCLSYLNGFSRYYHDKLGTVYIGNMGDEKMKLKIAVIKCHKGSSVPGGSTVAVIKAVEVLRPKAVFCMGFCASLSQNVKLGDIVVSAKLITYAPTKVLEDGIQERGVRAPVLPPISKLITHVADGWEAPLKDPEKLEMTVHRNGVFLSGPELVDNKERRKKLIERFSDAIAIEMEGEGLFVAAHDLNIPWIIIKGVSDFADGDKTKTNSWRPFASYMAASIVAHILHDYKVFRNWPNYESEYAEPRRAPKRSSEPTAADGSATYAGPGGKQAKLTAGPTDGPALRTRSSSTQDPHPKVRAVKVGNPKTKELPWLSSKIGDRWKLLGRQLEIDDAKLTKFHKENEELDEKAYKMLLHWIQRDGSDATYQVLYDALTDEMVNHKDLGEKMCLADTS